MYYSKSKKKIFNEIKESGYTILNNIYSRKKINGVKKSLLSMLHYIDPRNKNLNLQSKYHQIKQYKPILKRHFYDMCKNESEILRLVQDSKIVDIAKGFFNTDVIFSSSPGILIFEDRRFFYPHQETHQFSINFLNLWSPLYDAKGSQGGIAIYKDSHKHGYWKHNTNNKLNSTCVDPAIAKKFKRKILKVNAGSVLLMHSALIHESVAMKKKQFARFVLNDRLCPLKKLPYLTKENAPKRIPYPGHGEGGNSVDYNSMNIYLND